MKIRYCQKGHKIKTTHMLILVAVFNRQDKTQTDIVTDERGFRLNRQALSDFYE